MTIEELLDYLGLDSVDLKEDANSAYSTGLLDSDEFGRIFTLLDNNQYLEPDDERSLLTPDMVKLFYTGDDYTAILSANLIDDTYKFNIEEN